MQLGSELSTPVPIGPGGRPVLEFGAESFALLVEGIEARVQAGASASTDTVADATAVWVAMHGMHGAARLPVAGPGQFVSDFVRSLARIGA
jgi:hypothetical protein